MHKRRAAVKPPPSSDRDPEWQRAWPYQPCVVLVRKLDQLGGRPGVEGDLLVFGQLLGDEGPQAEEVAERGHGARVTAREQVFKLFLLRQLDLSGAGSVEQPAEIH